MGKRLLTSAIGLVVFFAVIFAHHYVLYIAGAILAVMLLFEVFHVMDIDKKARILGYIISVMICFGIAINKPMFAAVLSTSIYILSIVFFYGKVKLTDLFSSAVVTLTISLFISVLYLIRKYCDQYSVMIPFICAWMSDTGAYLTGSLFGKHKLAEKISPMKTIEGSIGGVLFSALGSVLYIIVLVKVFAEGMPSLLVATRFAVLGVTAGIISQIGDLAASCIKREYGKKDYGSILPGHGGLMDRFDSVLVTIPFVFYMLVYYII